MQTKTSQRSFAQVASDRDYAAEILLEARGQSYIKGTFQLLFALAILPIALVLWIICAFVVDFSGLLEAWSRISGTSAA